MQFWSYRYYPDGMLSRSVIIEGGPHDLRDVGWDYGDTGPLARNAFMVNEAMPRAVARGYEPRVLALVDSASRTKGADHTVGLARRAGYPVDRRVWTVTP